MKFVYMFNEGNKNMRELLGGKGANLAEMTNMGLPVPNGFTITTDACNKYYIDNETINDEIINQIKTKIKELENAVNKKLGDINSPLLVSVRSGSPISMPGMMDTILNLGLNDEITKELSKKTGIRFAYDSYRRLISMYADVVMGYDKNEFEKELQKIKKQKNTTSDLDLTDEDMYQIALTYKEVYKKLSGDIFPQDPEIQLFEAIKAVFRSWNNERAKIYRKLNKINDNLGTAVNIQEMVYGNLSDKSLTGVSFSRNPSNGENTLYGEFLEKAQGEDIVAGVRTPKTIDALSRDFPNIYNELKETAKILENHYKDMQDMEFTVEDGKFHILQTRNGKRTPAAALKIAVSLVNEKLIDEKEALFRLEPEDINGILHQTFNQTELKKATVIAKGLPASPGAAVGKICFDAKDIKDKNTILVRLETSPEDIEGMTKSDGILTVRGGITSHAAVVARGMGKCCVSGCESIEIDEKNKTLKANGKTYHEEDIISIDGTTGTVYEGTLPKEELTLPQDFILFMSWANKYKKLGVKANADTEKDAKTALKFGAEGIGLCRTEHMFFKADKIFSIRKFIIAPTEELRHEALEELLVMQQEDFEKIFKVMAGKVVTIRYLDPPLHEFLPKTEEEITKLSEALNITKEEINKVITEVKEFNPMMGHRGCRLAVTYPELAIMQTKAVINAAINVSNDNYNVIPEIMIPLVGSTNELKYLKNIVTKEADQIIKEKGSNIKYKVGTMIEVPRSTIIANELAKEADFFSFGTNDLTQMTYGFSRDDSGSFLNDYIDKKIIKQSPFEVIDKDGVGKLIVVAMKLAHKTKKDIEFGVCGEHGGNPESVEYFNNIGIDYVSCSPYRVPIAKLAAARAALKEENVTK